jgi:hypothetical protein
MGDDLRLTRHPGAPHARPDMTTAGPLASADERAPDTAGVGAWIA